MSALASGKDPIGIPVIPVEQAHRYNVVAIAVDGSKVVFITPRPMEATNLALLEGVTQRAVETQRVDAVTFARVMNATYGDERSSFNIATAEKLVDPQAETDLLAIIDDALTKHRSDLHFEWLDEDHGRIRLRTDRYLWSHDTIELTGERMKRLMNALTVKSNINADNPLPPGSFAARLPSKRKVDIRVQMVPTPYGMEAIVRLIGSALKLFTLNDLGMPKQLLNAYRMLMSMPYGLHLIVGPMNAGKTTTIYALMQFTIERIRAMTEGRAEPKIIEAADPIEIRAPGVTQIEINDSSGITFEKVVKTFVRTDPDLTVIGEMRDKETADACFNASMAGRQLVSSFHAFDAIGALGRLDELTVKPQAIQNGLRTILAQRLIPRLCQNCRTPDRMATRDVKAIFGALFGDEFEAPKNVASPSKGCPACHNTGIKGLHPVFELLPIDGALCEVLRRGGGYSDLANAALDSATANGFGYTPMATSALEAVSKGIITWEAARDAIFAL